MDALQKSITGFASETLKRRHKKLLKRGYGLAELDDETRYRARIAAKKVRYATEFLLPCSILARLSITSAR
jgi:CHAD domain-containing protein